MRILQIDDPEDSLPVTGLKSPLSSEGKSPLQGPVPGVDGFGEGKTW
jgi:hypothetical protein